MSWLRPLNEIDPQDAGEVGGKAAALARLAQEGLRVPPSMCLPASAYQQFVAESGLQARVLTELNRKAFAEMRWEEIWDCALRIRNMFLKTSLPREMGNALADDLTRTFGEHPVAVRSSAPGEDSAQASFAGLHESYLNIYGPQEILKHIRLVWASLWSDAALLYRQELGLDPRSSTMAVVVQALEAGRCSGVFFGMNPNDGEQSVIEAVHGLNQGLVDGQIAPDRWLIQRATQQIIEHTAPPERSQRMVAGKLGVETEALPDDLQSTPPLNESEVARVLAAGNRAETIFETPQDVEWTFTDQDLVILQSRPITSGDAAAQGDKRAWYLSLHRSFENLKTLEAKITQKLVPEMIQAAEAMAATDLTGLSDETLAEEIEKRRTANDHWVQVYWADFIPFAHGMRLFGQFYNDVMAPEDPFEFMRLLEKSDLVSLQRNRLMMEMARMVAADAALARRLSAAEELPATGAFAEHLAAFIRQFGDLTCPVTGGGQCRQGPEAVIRLVLELGAGETAAPKVREHQSSRELEGRFLNRLAVDQRKYGQALL
ncbi:MAG: PEP/pyruvate-binding domain-containing protein, partial [Desulfobacterales bacterium]